MATLTLGVTVGLDPEWSLSADLSESAEIADARHSGGQIGAKIAYSKGWRIQLTGMFDKAKAPPKIGTAMTYADFGTGLITEISISQSNTEYQRVTVTVQGNDKAAVGNYTESKSAFSISA